MDKLIMQTDNRLPMEINKWGCYYRSLQAIAELTVGKTLTFEQIIDMYYILQKTKSSINLVNPAMDSECFVYDPNAIINQAFKWLGSKKVCYQIGIKEVQNQSTVYWQWVKNKIHDWTIIQYKTKFGFHFALGNADYIQVFDPHPNASIVNIKRYVLYQLA